MARLITVSLQHKHMRLQGPLALAFRSDIAKLESLVRALFGNSEKRARFLRMIKQ